MIKKKISRTLTLKFDDSHHGHRAVVALCRHDVAFF